jgi:hypothetical protein
LICISFMDKDVEYFFICTSYFLGGHSYFFWELSVYFICPFIQWVVDSLGVWFCGLPVYPGY